jgi:hypothetical protein
MAQLHNVLLCAATGLALWTLLGWPIASRLAQPPFSAFLAPLLGWAVFGAIALPLFAGIGMSRPVVLVTVALSAAIALFFGRPPTFQLRGAWPWLALLAGAIVLACIPAAAILPKASPDGIALASPIFDHSKIALIDEMIRFGVPSQNPFFGEIGAPDRLAYYYLWHFSAAALAVITGVGGWEADAALTWFTGFASLLVMIGLAIRISGRRLAGWAVLVLAATASIRTVLEWIAPEATPSLIRWSSGFGGWLFQSSWAPQHVMSASCVVLAVLLMPRLASRGWLTPVILGLVAAAAFQSSVWVGGVVFAPAALAIGLHLLRSIDPARRGAFVIRVLLAAGLAVLLSLPFIHDQLASSALRGGHLPATIAPVVVLGEALPEGIRRILDVPAFWLIYLPVEFAAFYCAGLLGLVWVLRSRLADADFRLAVQSLALLAGASLFAAWLLASVIGDNNDLGWRGVLPGAMLLIVLAAAAISRWPERPARIAGALAAAGTLLALPETAGIARENMFGLPNASAQVFAATPSLWQAVRRHAEPGERIASNPLLLADMTPWPVNISWALLANRRSCYAGRELALPFAPIPAQRRAAIEAQFVRIFAGAPIDGDIEAMAGRFRCDVVVVTPQDGAWQRDPFQVEGPYRLIESQPGWRIYRRAALAQAH